MNSLFTRNRLFEWLTTSMMLGIAVILFFYPNMIKTSSFHYVTALGFHFAQLFWSFLIFGCLRSLALIANGHWRTYGPLLRALGATGGAFLWFTFSLSLWMASYEQSSELLGVHLYGCLAIGEIVAIFRAGTDVRYGNHKPSC